NQSVAVMALANTLFEKLRLLTKRHGPQLDVRDAGSRAHPDAASIVGNQIENFVVGQVAQAGKVLAAIERAGVVVDTHGALPRAVPQSPVAGSRDATCLTWWWQTRRDLNLGRDTWIGDLVKRPELLRIRMESNGFGAVASARG